MARRSKPIDVEQPRMAANLREVSVATSVAVCDPPEVPTAVPHHLEQQIRFELESRHSFSSLVVRRIPGGVCLQGVMHFDDSLPDITSLARNIAGVERVINQLVAVKRTAANESVS